MANIKNLAVGTVLTAPSPATAGTSLVMQSAQGLRYPAVPFFATAFAPGSLPSPSNAEIISVTAISTDTLTIVRAQKGTTAQSIASGWIISNAIYAEDLFNSSITYGEVLTGTPNGVLTAFTTAQAFTAIEVFKNGVRMQAGSGNDYTTSGQTVTFTTAPATGAKLIANYIVGSTVMISGSNSLVTDETPTGLINGSNTTFLTTQVYIGGSLQVYINGLKLKRGLHFTETSPSTGQFVISDAPLTGDDVMVVYQFVASTYGNADTVDGIHASATPTANQLVSLDSNAKLPISAQQPINKKLNTTSTAITSPRMETGVGAIVNATSVAITFTTTFNSIPTVLVTGAGGNASSNAFAWPAVTPAAFNDRSYAVGSHSTTGFTVYITGAAVGASQIAEFSWIAVGD